MIVVDGGLLRLMKGGMLSARTLAISGRGTRSSSKLSFPHANSGASFIVGKSGQLTIDTVY
jgi:hypothetical protein